MMGRPAFSFRKWMFHTLSRVPWVGSLLVVMGAGLFFYSRRAFDFIREESSSPRTDFSLRIYFYVGLLLVSFLVAVLLDALLNRKAWLRRVLGASEAPPSEAPDLTAYTRHPIQFYFYFLFASISLWFFYDQVNGGFHSYYNSVGKYMTLLRSSSEADRLSAIEHLASLRHPRMVQLLTARISSGTEKEKIFATWAVGNAEVNDPAIVQAISRNLDAVQDALRHASFLALARIVERPTVEFVRRIEEELRRSLAESRPPPVHLLFAAAFLRTPEFLPLFLDFFALDDPDTSVIATYAIVWMTGTTADQNRRILAQLDRNITASERLRCMNTVALLFKAPELSQETLMALRREFEAKSSDFRCRPEVFSLHPFDSRRDTLNITRINIQGFRYLATSSELYRERILCVLARVRDDMLIPWLERMSKNEQLPEYLRDLCRQTAQAKPRSETGLNW